MYDALAAQAIREIRALKNELAAKTAEVERLREALHNLLVMLPSDAPEAIDSERIPLGFCYVRWQDIREARAALEDLK